jgi:hypothetical protein
MELENLYFIYSHYCKHCKKILPKISSSLPHIKTICIDNKQFRDKILKNTTYNINYVPSIILITTKKVTIYQGEDATNYLKDKLRLITHIKKNTNKLEKDYNKLEKELEQEKINSLHLQNTIEYYKQELNNQTTTLTSKPINQVDNMRTSIVDNQVDNMRTSIDDILDYESDEEEISNVNSIPEKESLSEMAQRLQDARK